MTRVQYKCRGGYLRQKIDDINFVNAAMISHCVFSGCRYAQQVCVPLDLFGRGTWNKDRAEHPQKRRVLVHPSLTHDSNKGLSQFDLLGGASFVTAERKPTDYGHLRDAIGIANSMGDGRCYSLRYAQKCVTAQMQCIDHGFQIALKRLKGNLGDLAIGKAKTSTVIANEPEAIGEEAPERRPARVLPVVLKMGKPGWNTHERHALADTCHGKVNPILGPAKRDLLTAGGMTWDLTGAVSSDELGVSNIASSRTSPTNRNPLRTTVRIQRCCSPSSPTARRTALMRAAIADSETMRPSQTAVRRSSLLTTRSRFRIRKTRMSNTCGSTEINFPPDRSSRRSASRIMSPKRYAKSAPQC